MYKVDTYSAHGTPSETSPTSVYTELADALICPLICEAVENK